MKIFGETPVKFFADLYSYMAKKLEKSFEKYFWKIKNHVHFNLYSRLNHLSYALFGTLKRMSKNLPQ